VILLSCHS